jgi:hypothetical protein
MRHPKCYWSYSIKTSIYLCTKCIFFRSNKDNLQNISRIIFIVLHSIYRRGIFLSHFPQLGNYLECILNISQFSKCILYMIECQQTFIKISNLLVGRLRLHKYGVRKCPNIESARLLNGLDIVKVYMNFYFLKNVNLLTSVVLKPGEALCWSL